MGGGKHRRMTRTVLLISTKTVKKNLKARQECSKREDRAAPRLSEDWVVRTAPFSPADSERQSFFDSQRRVERELKGLILFLTHWVEASRMLVVRSKPHEYWRLRHHKVTTLNSKRKCGLRALQVLLPSLNQQTLIRIRMPFDVQDGRCTVRCTRALAGSCRPSV